MICIDTSSLFYGLCRHRVMNSTSGMDYAFDLQLFNGEKTEDPTAKRIADARGKGQVAKSKEINSVFVILSAFIALKVFGAYIYDQITEYMIFVFSNIPSDITIEVLMVLFAEVLILMVKTAFPIMFSIMLVAVVVNLYQVGFMFTLDTIMPKPEKLNPIAGAKRMFSKGALVELVKSFCKIIIVGYFIYRFLHETTMHLPKLIYSDISVSLQLLAGLIFSLIYQIGSVMFVLAILDFLYQKWQYKQNLKMSKKDIKDEMKQSEGDPKIKGKIKQKQREMAMQRMMQEVPKADVIVTNPTHYAVALKYEAGMSAPVVIAKGQDLIAQRIKALAKEAKVVIVENKPLARALYSTTEVGGVVPEELYKSVAEVLAYVYRLKKKLS